MNIEDLQKQIDSLQKELDMLRQMISLKQQIEDMRKQMETPYVHYTPYIPWYPPQTIGPFYQEIWGTTTGKQIHEDCVVY